MRDSRHSLAVGGRRETKKGGEARSERRECVGNPRSSQSLRRNAMERMELWSRVAKHPSLMKSCDLHQLVFPHFQLESTRQRSRADVRPSSWGWLRGFGNEGPPGYDTGFRSNLIWKIERKKLCWFKSKQIPGTFGERKPRGLINTRMHVLSLWCPL